MSSGSESDEDYVPGEPEQLSEEESANEETDQQYENEVDQKVKKRKIVQEAKGKKKQKIKNGVSEIESKSSEKSEEISEETEAPQNPEEVKKKEDELWAKFLEGTESQRKKSRDEVRDKIGANAHNLGAINNAVVKKPQVPIYTPNPNSNEPMNDKPTDLTKKENKQTESIFEFAGETIVVENNKIKEKIKTAESPATGSKQDGPSRGRSGGAGGLAGVLGQLNKKNKLSTLEKSKLDWCTYKKEEGIEEEIESHNKGKNGYLDRQDFLERSDVRQYEIERDLRMNRRSNR